MKSDIKNPLSIWYMSQYEKVGAIIELEKLSIDEIPEFFLYDNLSQKHPYFCPLYKTGEICHSGIDKKNFCCLFCGCPFYDYYIWDDEKALFGRCTINSKFGKRLKNGMWDCTNCNFVHNIDWVKSNRKIVEKLLNGIGNYE